MFELSVSSKEAQTTQFRNFGNKNQFNLIYCAINNSQSNTICKDNIILKYGIVYELQYQCRFKCG